MAIKIFLNLCGMEQSGTKIMDANKLNKLREIKYRYQKVCGDCAFSHFPINDWGTCKRHTYFHNKHKEHRFVSIHKFGVCPSHGKGFTQPFLDAFIIKIREK